MNKELKICLTRDVKTPQRGTELSAGIDFFVPNDFNNGENFCLKPGERINIPSGVKIDFIASGLTDYCLIFFNKSGISVKHGLLVGAQVVDADYQGEVHLNVLNVSSEDVEIIPGMKLVQGILVPVTYSGIQVCSEDELFEKNTVRGNLGFGKGTGEF